MVRERSSDPGDDSIPNVLRMLAEATGERPLEPAHAAGRHLDHCLFEDWNRVARAAGGLSVLHFVAWLREAADAATADGRIVLLVPGCEMFRRLAIKAGAQVRELRVGPYVFDPVSTARVAAAPLAVPCPSATRVDGDLAAVAKGVPAWLQAVMSRAYDEAADADGTPPRRIVLLGPWVKLAIDGDEGRLTAVARYFVDRKGAADA